MAEVQCPKCQGVRKIVDPQKRQVKECPRCKGRGRVKVVEYRTGSRNRR